jgi:hypothetical protein
MNPPVDVEAHIQLQRAAREWQKLQIAVLGFVGLCGMLRGDSGSEQPRWLQGLSGIAAVAALVIALLAVTIVATVAHPLGTRPHGLVAASRRLRVGIGITFVAVGLIALSALSMWWPRDGGDRSGGAQAPQAQILVTTNSGSTCGTFVSSASGSLDLAVDGSRVRVPLNRLVTIQAVTNC